MRQITRRLGQEPSLQGRPRAQRTGASLTAGLLLFVGCALLTGCGPLAGVVENMRRPAKPFAATTPPPSPDYALAAAWLAFPGRGGLERSTPAGMAPVDEKAAPADVFFIAPTTYLKNDVWNAPYDVDGPYNKPVLLGQLSAFNGCCRLYAPHYRQASLAAQGKSPAAVQLAFNDVQRAFRFYIAHHNAGRPFIIAAHSQGARLAVELLQTDILKTPLQKRLIAAYVVGAYAPERFSEEGLGVCADAAATGCIVSWNTTQVGRTGAFMLIHDKDTWWRGAERRSGHDLAVCVNPLTWTQAGAASKAANPGSLPFPHAPFPTAAAPLPALTPALTGAVCKDKLLKVDARAAPPGYRDSLSFLFGSYHKSDYGLFYGAVRANAVQRVAAYLHRARAS